MDGAKIGIGKLHGRKERELVTNYDQGGQKNGQGQGKIERTMTTALKEYFYANKLHGIIISRN